VWQSAQLAKKLLLDIKWGSRAEKLALLTDRGGVAGLTPFVKAVKEKRMAVAIALLRIAMELTPGEDKASKEAVTAPDNEGQTVLEALLKDLPHQRYVHIW